MQVLIFAEFFDIIKSILQVSNLINAVHQYMYLYKIVFKILKTC